VVRILVPGWDLPSSHAALELAARYPDLLVPSIGVHPHHAAETSEEAWGELETLAEDSTVRAIGEIGLDFFRNLSPQDVQREALARQLALASRVARPVIVHDRDAHDAVSDALLRWAAEFPGITRPRGVLHCFSGAAPMAERLAAAGYLVSFALPVSFRSASGPRAAAVALPAEAILVETDAPWLGAGPEQRNEPTTVLRVAAEIARLRGIGAVEVAASANAALARLLG
jgi:TatD DNase family protein